MPDQTHSFQMSVMKNGSNILRRPRTQRGLHETFDAFRDKFELAIREWQRLTKDLDYLKLVDHGTSYDEKYLEQAKYDWRKLKGLLTNTRRYLIMLNDGVLASKDYKTYSRDLNILYVTLQMVSSRNFVVL